MFKEIANDIITSMESELNGYIIDKRLINQNNFNKLINMSGIEKIVKRVDLDNLIVLYIDESSIEKRCLYDGCSAVQDKIEKKNCVKECLINNIASIKEEIKKSLEEAAKNLDRV